MNLAGVLAMSAMSFPNLKQIGISIIQSGTIYTKGGTKYAYLDTSAQCGIIISVD